MLIISKTKKKLLNSSQNNELFASYLLIKDFINPEYQQINIARLQHLESLQLDLKNKSVIEFGAGIGDHTAFYLTKNCKVLPTDGRKELVEYISKRFCIKAMQLDLEKDLKKLKKFDRFDIIHCYGILYHITNPIEFLNAIKNLGKIVLLETCVTQNNKDKKNIVSENAGNVTQSISGKGCRPDREWLYWQLKKIYKYVYIPVTQPKHEEFPIKWDVNMTSSPSLTRCIFIASHMRLSSKLLTQKLIKNYRKW